MHHSQANRLLVILACLLTLVCLAASINRCLQNLSDVEYLAEKGDATADPRLGADMRIYISTVSQYLATGQLYVRPTHADETVASVYVPMTPISRLTPAFHLQLLPIAKSRNPEAFIKPLRFAMIAAYCLACLALIIHISRNMRNQNQSGAKILLFCTLSAIAATSNYGLQDAIILTNFEIPIFSLLIASFFLFHKHPRLTAIIIGYLASTKYYPALMASLLLTKWDKKTIATLFLTVLFFFAMGFLAFGQQENIFYFSQVLPVLLSEKVAPIMYNMSFGGAMFRFSQNLEFTQAAFQIYRFIFLGLSCFLLAKHYGNYSKSNIEVFALLMALMLICLPNYWQTYLFMLFPAFCVAIYRVVIYPSAPAVVILLICIASMAFDNGTWLYLGAPAWLTNNAVTDELGNRIAEAANHQNVPMAILIFARHYPWTVFLLFLEQIKPVVPAILWIFTAREIMSPADTQRKQPESTDFIKP